VLIGAAALYWFEVTSLPPAPQHVAVAPPAEQPAKVSLPAPRTDVTPAPLAPPAPPASPAPRPDQLAWDLLKDTGDDAALHRFVAQYPDSPLRQGAEARIATLEAARTPQPPPLRPDEVAWDLLKDTTDQAALKRFIAQYPDSTWRNAAEDRVAKLEAVQTAKPAPANPVDLHELARSLQFELKRVGCFDAAVNGEYDDATKVAWRRFAKLAAVNAPDGLSSDAIKAIRQIDKRVCPLTCPAGQHPESQKCIENKPAPKAVQAAPRPQPARSNNSDCHADGSPRRGSYAGDCQAAEPFDMGRDAPAAGTRR